jgi:nicotinamidase-related amidase
MKIPAEKTAIVLIEPQNDFLSEGGTMYAYIKDQLAERNVIANLQDLLKNARGKVAKIFYVPFHAFEEGFPELKKGGPGYEGLRGIEIEMEADWGKGAWLKGTPGPEIIPQLTPQKGDIVVNNYWKTHIKRKIYLSFKPGLLKFPGGKIVVVIQSDFTYCNNFIVSC